MHPRFKKKEMKKEILVYISIAALSFGFLVISILLNWNRKNPKLTAKKIKLGAALLTLTSILNSCSGSAKGVVTCYDVSAPDSIKTEIKKDTLTNDNIPKASDTIRIDPSTIRATCYGAPANFNTPNK